MLSTYQSTVINASLADVWERVSDFHNLSWASKVISECEKVGDIGGREVGARRLLNGVFHETLTHIGEEEHVIEYSIDDGPSPISQDEVRNYRGLIQLKPVTEVEGDLTFIEWSSSWESDSEEAVEFCHGIYVALLGELVASF